MPKHVDKTDQIRTELLKFYSQFKGKGGNPECESVLVDSNGDKDYTCNGKAPEGCVSIWSNKKDAALIIERCGPAIVKFEELGDGVQFWIMRSAFRGIEYAFKIVK